MWEVLYYAAMLRLPRTMTKEQKMQRVSTVIQALGIEKCKDTIIGERGLLTGTCVAASVTSKTISLSRSRCIGKRLSFAC